MTGNLCLFFSLIKTSLEYVSPLVLYITLWKGPACPKVQVIFHSPDGTYGKYDLRIAIWGLTSF